MSMTTTKKRRPIVGYRTMTAAQRYNARMERLMDDCKDAQTRFNASSRTDDNDAPATTQVEAEVLRPWAERAASRIWQMVNDRGQDALSHVDYAQIIREEFDADFKEALLRA